MSANSPACSTTGWVISRTNSWGQSVANARLASSIAAESAGASRARRENVANESLNAVTGGRRGTPPGKGLSEPSARVRANSFAEVSAHGGRDHRPPRSLRGARRSSRRAERLQDAGERVVQLVRLPSGDLIDDMANVHRGWELPSDETIKVAVHLHQASVELRDSLISGVCGDGPLFLLCSHLAQRFF